MTLALAGTVASSRRTGGGGPGPSPSSSILTKPKVAGMYWVYWETFYPDTIPSGCNMLLVSFALPSGSAGAVAWPGMAGGLSQSTFQTRVQTTRAAGRTVLLSIGGEGITYLLDSTTKVDNLVASVKSIYNAWGGFDGIDWDVENQVTPTAYYVAASRALKDFYGDDFAISCSYAGTSDEPWNGNLTTYKAISQQLESSGDLDMSTIQYYDYGNGTPENPYPATSHVQSRLNEMVTVWGVSAEHLGVGVKAEPGNPTTWTTASMLSCWNTVEATYPTLRGMNLWETIQNRQQNANGFTSTVAPAITS